MRVRALLPQDRADWLRMRLALWPDSADEHGRDIDDFLAGNSRILNQVIVCETEDRSIGFIELRIRNCAEGSDRTEVPYVEGWYVDAGCRGRGVGALLMAAAERWAKGLGYSELASDAEIENDASLAAHLALGFEETDRIVCFLKKI